AAVNATRRRLGLAARARPHRTIPHRVTVEPEPRESWPPVSVVVATRDAPEHIGRCLESIFSLTAYPSFEVVVVDNGTTDERALEILARHPVKRLEWRRA